MYNILENKIFRFLCKNLYLTHKKIVQSRYYYCFLSNLITFFKEANYVLGIKSVVGRKKIAPKETKQNKGKISAFKIADI